MRKWQQELCAVRPKELELVNRDTFIQRRNIEPYEREGMDGQTETGFTCESRFLSLDEYYELQEQEAKQSAILKDLLTSMGGQADIYEAIMEQQDNQMLIMSGMADIYEEIEAIKVKEGGA